MSSWTESSGHDGRRSLESPGVCRGANPQVGAGVVPTPTRTRNAGLSQPPGVRQAASRRQKLRSALSDPSGSVRGTGERRPARGTDELQEMIPMQYLVSVLDDGTGPSTATEDAAIDVFN